MEMYKEDAYHYDDFNDNQISKTLNKLNESISILEEHTVKSYAQTINEFKNSLQSNEEKEIMDDFIQYCKYYNK